MISSTWAKLVAWLTGLLTSFFVPLIAFWRGTEHQKSKEAVGQLKELRDVKKIHDRIDSDPDYRERVQREYDKP